MKKTRCQGPAVKVGDNIDTDAIIPARYLSSTDPRVLADHCLEILAPEHRERIRPGTILVAGSNFGCGSSREHAPVALQARGIQAVVAQSFARIFFRNGINLGLPLIEIPEAAEIPDGEEIEIDLGSGKIQIPGRDQSLSFAPLPRFAAGILEAGGLIAYLQAGGKFDH